MADTSTLYDQDFYVWLGNNANLLREGRLDAIDAVHLAEELEDMGRSKSGRSRAIYVFCCPTC